MYCGNCSLEIRREVNYCPHCGYLVNRTGELEESRKCPWCGHSSFSKIAISTEEEESRALFNCDECGFIVSFIKEIKQQEMK